VLLLLGFVPLAVSARTAAVADTVAVVLDSTVVTGARRTSLLRETPGAALSVDVAGISRLPSLLGTSDPIRFTRYLPSVQTGSELDAGLHIEGCDAGHNIISSGGVPVYGAIHLLGLFSVFNPSHFRSMDYATSTRAANRLGGSIDMQPDFSIPNRPEADFSLGLVSAQGTVRAQIGRRSALTVSARKSFLNLLYGKYLRVDDEPFRYGFDDCNLTWVYRPTTRDVVWADAYFGSDAIDYSSSRGMIGAGSSWWNAYGALHWNHGTMEQTCYLTAFNLDLDMTYSGMSGTALSYMQTLGYKGSYTTGNWRFRLDAAWHEALPQQVFLSIRQDPETERQTALETTAGAAWGRIFWDRLRVEASCDGMFYLSPERKPSFLAAPELTAELNLYRAGRLGLKTGLHRQPLFQTGMTSLGLPIEFWFLAGKYSAPQTSFSNSLNYDCAFLQDRYSLSVETYYRRLFNQVEYDGTIFDLVSTSYKLEDMLVRADGWNYGLNLMLHKRSGKLTGWVSGAIGRSLRRAPDGEIFPSAHERLYEFNLVATWDGGRWDAGASFVAASGTPYTAPETLYLVGNRVICRYGPRNGERLGPYIRLDLSTNVYFHRDGRSTQGLNFSLYNALGRDNEISRRLRVQEEEDGVAFAYTSFSFALRFMPSIGWFYRF